MKSLLATVLALILQSCQSASPRFEMNLSDTDSTRLVAVLSEYNYGFERAYENLPEMLELVMEADSFARSKGLLWQEVQLVNYTIVDDSLGLYFWYEEQPALFKQFTGMVGEVIYRNNNFKIKPKSSYRFSEETIKATLQEGKRILNDRFLNYGKSGCDSSD